MALMNMFAAIHDEDQRCQVGGDGMDLDKLEECLNNLKVKNENTDAEIGLQKAAEKQMLERLISMVQDKISLAKKKNSETK